MRVQIGAMTTKGRTFGRVRAAAFSASAALALAATPLRAAPCAFEPQGEGHVAAVVSGRSFRLTDGREIKLAGIEPVSSDATKATAALSATLAGKDVTLHGEDDAPDRYGRQRAFVFLAGGDTPVQGLLLAEGAAVVSTEVTDKDCAAVLMAAEAAARGARREKGHLGRSGGHKKRGKYRRYFGRDWAIHACRGHGFVRTTGWGNDLPELRTTLDTGLRCDYFKAHADGCGGCRHARQVTGESADSGSWLG
jgi:endonuclease YncB( thermonuclease family)